MIRVDEEVQFEDYSHYLTTHPIQSLESKLLDAEFKKRMADALLKEKINSEKNLYDRENSGVVITTNIHHFKF